MAIEAEKKMTADGSFEHPYYMSHESDDEFDEIERQIKAENEAKLTKSILDKLIK